ncbi:uncharacterized protein A1O9_08626 [Exophiala aquamarina CBS 119918]|uniref:Mid2 domain-containing protein n=1 Tax=Exophiala aquamarina CBS 119918 TaxID=1182545 RepID=A0A072P4E8_9EURO|nr:uncharacterized protein A1O9_08626 [Exophiala aquamarina CBS 119918]KEF54974.1 hypothetical protein A1O9_08626 [Exophiala aquamarina CBS 119918]
MAGLSLIASTVSQVIAPTAIELPFSQITAAPKLTHQRDLLRRAATVDSATCGWVNGDHDDALACADPYHQPCLWNSNLHVVGCCAASATSDCNWKTSCVPWASVNYGCDSDCQKNAYNLICPSDRPLCAMATFAGPAGYSYNSCTDKSATTETVHLTWQGGDATIQNLPRYYASYWSSSSGTSTTNTKSSGTATKSSVTATPTSSSSNNIGSWIQRHKWAVIGAVVGVLIVVLLLLVCCVCHIRRKRKDRNRGAYAPAGQVLFPGTQENVPLTGYRPYERDIYAKT